MRDKKTFLLGLLLFVLLVWSPQLWRSLRENLALVMATKALMASTTHEVPDIVERAEIFLRQTLDQNAGRRILWHRLGFILAVQGREAEAQAAWHMAGGMDEELQHRGERAHQAKRYREAVAWYRRATALAPHRALLWYRLGRLYERLERWPEALHRYERAVAAADTRDIGRSRPYYRMGLLYQRRLRPKQPTYALTAYAAALTANDFLTDREAAHCYFRRAELLRRTEAPLETVIAALQQALVLAPDHVWSRLLLGVALYQGGRDATAAAAEIRQALALDPENKWAYYHLGKLHQLARQPDKARHMYERALHIDPAFRRAQHRLEALETRP